MTDETGGSESRDKKVLVIALKNDRDTLESLELEGVLQDLGFECVFSYDEDLGSRTPSEFDRMKEACSKFLLVVSKDSLSDSWMEHFRKYISQYAPFVIDPTIEIAKLPVEIKVFTCITVRDDRWKNKLSTYLGKQVAGCPPLGKLAPGLCCSYVDGFLDTVFPVFGKSLEEWEQKNPPKDGGLVVKKMLNLIPNSCNCVPFKDFQSIAQYDPANIRKEKETVKIKCDYLDTRKRNFDLPVYRVTDPENNSKIYYVVLVLNSTIHTLFEMSEDPECGLDIDTMMKERSLFETQMMDMVIGKPIEIVPFDDQKPSDLTEKIVEKCRLCVQ